MGPKSSFGKISLLQCTGQNQKQATAHSSSVGLSRVKWTAILGEGTFLVGILSPGSRCSLLILKLAQKMVLICVMKLAGLIWFKSERWALITLLSSQFPVS